MFIIFPIPFHFAGFPLLLNPIVHRLLSQYYSAVVLFFIGLLAHLKKDKLFSHNSTLQVFIGL